MSFTIDLLPGEPIVLEIFNKDYKYALEGEADADQALAMLNRLASPVFYIVDMTAANFGVDDLMIGASLATRRTAMFRHPNMREIVPYNAEPDDRFSRQGP